MAGDYQPGKPLPQLPALTSLRGIAALMVCLMHFSETFQPQVESWLSAHTALFTNAYLWVDFFFLLSGFVLTHVYGEHFADGLGRPAFKRFLVARFARIYPLHFAMLAVLFARELVLVVLYLQSNGLESWRFGVAHGETVPFSGSFSLVELLRQLLLVQSLTVDTQHISWNFPAWSIGTEWFAYLVLPLWIALGYRPLLRARPVAIWLALAAGVLALAWIGRQTPYDLDIAGFWGLARCIIESQLGMVAYALYRRGLPVAVHSSWLVLLVVAALVAAMHVGVTDALVIPLFVLLVLGCSRNHGVFGRVLAAAPLVLLGEVSYSVYLVHTPLRLLLADGWLWLTGHGPGDQFGLPGSIGLWLLGAALVVAVSWLTYRFIELPWQRRLRRLA